MTIFFLFETPYFLSFLIIEVTSAVSYYKDIGVRIIKTQKHIFNPLALITLILILVVSLRVIPNNCINTRKKSSRDVSLGIMVKQLKYNQYRQEKGLL